MKFLGEPECYYEGHCSRPDSPATIDKKMITAVRRAVGQVRKGRAMGFGCVWAGADGAHGNEGIVLCGGHSDGGVVCVAPPAAAIVVGVQRTANKWDGL